MKASNPILIQGPIITGQMDLKGISLSSEQPIMDVFINRIQILLTSFSALGCISLVLVALLHHHLTAISTSLLALAPVPILTGIIAIYRGREQPVERTVTIVEWLKQTPSMSLFSTSEKINLGWLTDEGLYTFTKSHYPWGALKISSFEPDFHALLFEDSHLLILQAYEKSTAKYWLLILFLGLLSIIILATTNSLLIFLKQYGFRADVISLVFAIFFDILAWMMFCKALFKINRDMNYGWKLPFFINVRHVQLDDLTKFVERHR